MSRKGTLVVYIGAAAACLLMLGFILFANSASRRPFGSPLATVGNATGTFAPGQTADGIVVLTGAQRRIEAGLDLLQQGSAHRLLISGVNRRVTPDEVLRLNGTMTLARGCCVDFGYDAQDTIGNASETRAWAAYHGFKRLIVVTSSYHMPRSLNELALALPDIELIAHPVVPRILGERPWWLSASAIRILAAEYVKLVPSYARYGLVKTLWGAEPVTVARSPGDRAVSLARP